MTKRMLSLLLALVMTLSLCVPALAADEFAAEAVTDVEEQAPVAPEAPVEPEAEEPAEEPVVDEPAVEEPAVEDAPELASIMEEEAVDEPVVITIGEITVYGEDYLDAALKLAEPFKAMVDAGEAYLADDGLIESFPAFGIGEAYEEAMESIETRNDDFLNAYEEAVRCQNGMAGEDVGDDVTDDGVRAVAEQLISYIPEDVTKAPASGDTKLTSAINSTMEGFITTNLETNLILTDEQDDVDLTDEATIDARVDSHRPNYVAAVKEAVAASEAFKDIDDPDYADYKAVEDKIAAAWALIANEGGYFKDQVNPMDMTEDDVAELYAAVDAVQAVIDNRTWNQYLIGDSTPASKEDAQEIVDDVKTEWYEDIIGSIGVKKEMKYTDLRDALNELALTKIDNDAVSVKIVQDKNKAGNYDGLTTVTAEVAFDVTNTDITADKDTTKYYYTYDVVSGKVHAYYGDGETKDGAAEYLDKDPKVYAPIYSVDNSDDGTKKIAKLDLGTLTMSDGVKLGKFSGNDQITVHIFKKNYNTYSEVAHNTFKVPANAYDGPVLSVTNGKYDIEVNDGSDSADTQAEDLKVLPTADEYDAFVASQSAGDPVQVEVKINTKFPNIVSADDAADGDFIGYELAVLSKGTVVGSTKNTDTTNAFGTGTEATVALSAAEAKKGEYAVNSTDLKVELRVAIQGQNKNSAVKHDGCEATVKIDSLADWFKVDKGLSVVVKLAKAMNKNDYELDKTAETLNNPDMTYNNAWSLREQAIAAGEKILNNASTTPNTSVNRQAALNALNDIVRVCSWLKLKEDVNLDALKDAIHDTADLYNELFEDETTFSAYDTELPDQDANAEVYTYTSWKALQDAYAKAVELLGDTPSDTANAAEGVTQSDVDEAAEALVAALKALVELDTSVDKTALQAAVDAAEALNEEGYTAESWAAAKPAIDMAVADAKDVLENESATQPQVNAVLAALNAAMAKLVKPTDKTDLEAAIAAAEELNEEDYTAESWAAMAEALDAAKVVDADETATQDEVDAAAEALNAAIDALAEANPEVDKTQLEGTIAEAEAKVEADYTAESWAAMAEALEAAKTVAADEAATQEDVDAAAKALADAMDALVEAGDEPVEPADKSELIAGIAVITALSEYKDEFTAESWAAVEAALEAAEAVLDDESATQEEVDAAVEAMVAALEALEEVPAVIPPAPSSGTGWVENDAGDIYFYQKGEVKKSFWVGKADGASKWDGNWYYVGSDGKLVTGMAYLDDLHGGYGWYFLQPTNTNGEIGKMLTGWQWVGGEYGTCYFSTKSGSSGKCTYSTELGDWTGTTWAK